MSTYTGKPVTIKQPASRVVERFADLSKLQGAFDNLNDSQKQQMGEVRLEPKAIVIINPMAGEIRFEITHLSEDLIKLECAAPMAMSMNVHMNPVDGGTEITTEVDVDIPVMLRPLIGPFIQKAANGIGALITTVAAADAADADSVQ